jgi:asparagine synthase (glutamine-hydrolysing)
MIGRLSGVFDPCGRSHQSMFDRAVGPEAATLLDLGLLTVVFSGQVHRAGSQVCLLDGVLDNFDELARELGETSDSPAERVLAAGYRRWGEALLPRLRGDFIVLLWDQNESEGLIARDQLGVRSLYLHESSGRTLFASEIHQLLALLATHPAPDPVSVAHWLAASNRPGAHTMYEGVRRLNPGSMLLLNRGGARERTYWTPTFAPPLDLSATELASHMREGLAQAVRRRAKAVPHVGVLMSGGVDSASVAAMAVAHADGQVSAHAGVFPEHPTVDESTLIDELRSVLELPGLTAEVRPGGLVASALESTSRWQLPLLGWGDFWTVPLLREAAATGVTVTLGGDGGDELYGTRAYLLADRMRAVHVTDACRLARMLPGAGEHPPARQFIRVLGTLALRGALPAGAHGILERISTSRQLPDWLRPAAARDVIRSEDPVAWKSMDGPLWWAHVAHGITRGVEEAGIFEHQRLRAALTGVQARHPFFDLDLVQLALRQPPRATLDRDRNRPVLRASVTGMLPDSVRLRPAKAWFDRLIFDCLTGPDREVIRRLLTRPDSEVAAFVDLEAVRRDILDPDASRAGFGWIHRIWRLITAEVWLRAQANPTIPPWPGPRPSEPCVAVRTSAPSASPSYVFQP